MGTIHLIGGEKGGVGKSVVARLLGQYFIDHGIAARALDADGSNPAMLRHYADLSAPLDLRDSGNLDQVVECALEEGRRVIVDLPAQSGQSLREWIESADVVRLSQEHGIALRHWHVSDGGYDSVRMLGAVVEQYPKDVTCVVVRNHGRSRDFSQLEESPHFAELRALGGQVFDLPELEARVMFRIDRHGSSFWAAAQDTTSQLRLPLLDRGRIGKWLRKSYEGLDAIRDVL